MACVRSGVLVKLLEELNHNEKGSEEDRKPVLLQIRSIIPVLEEGDLWPNRGFYLKVSDLSHAIYVSLPQEQNEMILSNKLKLGQLMHVQRLEASHPVPLLRGITPVPGRRPCDGTREDILPANNLVKFLEASDTYSIVEKGVISEKKISESLSDSRKSFRGSSDTEALTRKHDGDLMEEARGRIRSSSASKARPGEPRLGLNYVTKRCDLEKRIFDVMVEIKKTRESSVENDSDSDSTRSSLSSIQLSKRRSWTESEFLRSKEIFDSSIVKSEKRTVTRSRSRSTHVSPVRSVRGDSSDDNLSSIRRRREINPPKKFVKSSNKTRLPAVKKNAEEISYPPISSSADDSKDAENRIPWDSLPSSLVKLGKEVIRERDAAILAAVEALQEACAAQRLIRCLSSYSEFQSAEEDGLQQSVDKFFELQDGLANSRLITHSLTNISPLRTSDADLSSAATVKEVLDLAVERKKNASSWIKSAVTHDLCPFADSLKLPMTTTDPTNTLRKPVSENQVVKPKGATIMIRKQRRNSDIPIVLATDKEGQVAWSRGSTLVHTAELATSLQDECQKWFLNRVEKYLDEVENKVAYLESDSQRAGMMYRIKRVNDWLESIVGKERDERDESKESSMLNESDIEACERVRNKIYGILLKHVERTAMALETM